MIMAAQKVILNSTRLFVCDADTSQVISWFRNQTDFWLTNKKQILPEQSRQICVELSDSKQNFSIPKMDFCEQFLFLQELSCELSQFLLRCMGN